VHLLVTGKVLATMRSCDGSDVNAAVSSAQDAFKNWSQLSGMQRGKLLMKAAQILRVSFKTLPLGTLVYGLVHVFLFSGIIQTLVALLSLY